AEDERRLGGDPLQQAAVLPGHREDTGGAAAVEQRHEAEAVTKPAESALGLEGDDELERAVEFAARPLAAESLEVLAGEVHAPDRGVLCDVAQDVADLERNAEIVGQRRARPAVGAVEDAEREPADRAGDAATVALEVGERL